MQFTQSLFVLLTLVAFASGQDSAPANKVSKGPGAKENGQPDLTKGENFGEAPLIVMARASHTLSRDFGLDGPHQLTLITLKSPNLCWVAKQKTRDWRFDQVDPLDPSSITIYLDGPSWHRKNETQILRADGTKVDESTLVELLAKPTPVLLLLSGQNCDLRYRQFVKAETLVLILGPRDLELMPRLSDGTQKNVMHWTVAPVGKSKRDSALPTANVVTDKKAFVQLWTELELQGTAPEIDFHNYFVAVHETYGNHHKVRVEITTDGDAQIHAEPTTKGPGPVFIVAVVSRLGIRSFRGSVLPPPPVVVPLPAEKNSSAKDLQDSSGPSQIRVPQKPKTGPVINQ